MAALVTKATDRSVENFIKNVDSISKQEDSRLVIDLIQEISGLQPNVWGNEKVSDFIIGFGKYSYQRKNSKVEFEWFKIGFAPRKTKLTLYLRLDIEKEKDLSEQLGKCKIGKGFLYINKIANINLEALKQLVIKSLTN